MRKGFPLFIPVRHTTEKHFRETIGGERRRATRLAHVVYGGGGADDLICDLVEMKVQRDAQTTPGGLPNERCMDDTTFMDALQWVNRHFAIIDPDDVANTNVPFTLDAFQYEAVKRLTPRCWTRGTTLTAIWKSMAAAKICNLPTRCATCAANAHNATALTLW